MTSDVVLAFISITKIPGELWQKGSQTLALLTLVQGRGRAASWQGRVTAPLLSRCAGGSERTPVLVGLLSLSVSIWTF